MLLSPDSGFSLLSPRTSIQIADLWCDLCGHWNAWESGLWDWCSPGDGNGQLGDVRNAESRSGGDICPWLKLISEAVRTWVREAERSACLFDQSNIYFESRTVGVLIWKLRPPLKGFVYPPKLFCYTTLHTPLIPLSFAIPIFCSSDISLIFFLFLFFFQSSLSKKGPFHFQATGFSPFRRDTSFRELPFVL